MEKLNRMMIGWANYFCLGPVSKAPGGGLHYFSAGATVGVPRDGSSINQVDSDFETPAKETKGDRHTTRCGFALVSLQ